MEKNKPYFFKLAIGDYIKERLKIPQLFVKKLSADTPNEAIMRVTIKGVAGQRPIMLRKRIDGTYLEDGWEKVVKDNFLGDHEFLLFSEFLQAFVRSIFLYLDQRWSPSEILKVKVGK
uniref:TF-B3 domain-containing protein n=1 Tax=Opuntia streptacantha TaxID=393608 RepID=A0A7C9EBA4_OPUST